MLLVVLMCVERFTALKFPFKYNTYFTMKSTMAIICILLLYSVSKYLLKIKSNDTRATKRIQTHYKRIKYVLMMKKFRNAMK